MEHWSRRRSFLSSILRRPRLIRPLQLHPGLQRPRSRQQACPRLAASQNRQLRHQGFRPIYGAGLVRYGSLEKSCRSDFVRSRHEPAAGQREPAGRRRHRQRPQVCSHADAEQAGSQAERAWSGRRRGGRRCSRAVHISEPKPNRASTGARDIPEGSLS